MLKVIATAKSSFLHSILVACFHWPDPSSNDQGTANTYFCNQFSCCRL